MHIELPLSVNRTSGIFREEQKWYSMNMSVCLPVIFITLRICKQGILSVYLNGLIAVENTGTPGTKWLVISDS
mgnify:CR=1 FL=1